MFPAWMLNVFSVPGPSFIDIEFGDTESHKELIRIHDISCGACVVSCHDNVGQRYSSFW